MDGDGAAVPGVEMTEGVRRPSTAKHHQPIEQLLLGDSEEEQGQAAVCNAMGNILARRRCANRLRHTNPDRQREL